MWPIIAYFAFVLVLVTAVLLVSHLLGPRHSEPATGQPYEGGIVSKGSAHVRFAVRYYLIAIFFVVFDLEAVFLFAWSVAARELGWAGYGEVFLFVALLGAALTYLWKIGALDWAWEPRRSRSIRCNGHSPSRKLQGSLPLPTLSRWNKPYAAA